MIKSSSFIGVINGVSFDKQVIFDSTVYVLECIEDKFGEIYNQDFIKEISYIIYQYYFKYDYSIETIECLFNNVLDQSQTEFSELYFINTELGDEHLFKRLNVSLKNREYVNY